MGPIWDRQDPGGAHVGPMNFAIWVYFHSSGVALKFVRKPCAFRHVVIQYTMVRLVTDSTCSYNADKHST